MLVRFKFSRRSIIRPALSKRAVSVPFRQLQPVPVDLDLIVGVDGCDTVFQIHDGRDCSFEDHVGNPGRIVAGDRARAIDPDLQVQAVVEQKIAEGAPGSPRKPTNCCDRARAARAL